MVGWREEESGMAIEWWNVDGEVCSMSEMVSEVVCGFVGGRG